MRIASVEISNIKGIKSASFPLGSVTVIRGANGTGKTSIVDAISAVFAGGHDPDLIRLGADKARVALTLDDGTVIAKTITHKNSTLDITTAQGLKVTKPAAWVAQLASGFQFDPIAFLEADSKKRTQFLLEAMPIKFTPAELKAITGTEFARPVGLDEFAALRQGIYDKRRDANVAKREVDATLSTLRENLPEGDDQDWPGIVAAHRQKQADLRAELKSVTDIIASQARERKAALSAQYDSVVSQAKAACAEAIRQAEAARDAAINEALAVIHRESAAVDAEAQAAQAEQTAEINAELVTVSGELATAEERQRAQAKADGLRQQIKDFSKRAEGKLFESLQCDAQLKSLDELKVAKLSESGIPGVEIVDGEIRVDGIPLDSLNTQRQYVVAFQVATLKSGELGFLVCDRAESLVGADWEAFKEAAAESGYQVLFARAEAGEPLALDVDGEMVEVGTQKGGRK